MEEFKKICDEYSGKFSKTAEEVGDRIKSWEVKDLVFDSAKGLLVSVKNFDSSKILTYSNGEIFSVDSSLKESIKSKFEKINYNTKNKFIDIGAKCSEFKSKFSELDLSDYLDRSKKSISNLIKPSEEVTPEVHEKEMITLKESKSEDDTSEKIQE